MLNSRGIGLELLNFRCGSVAARCRLDLVARKLPAELADRTADARVDPASAISRRSRPAACRRLNIIVAILVCRRPEEGKRQD
jgi:hypothetical protein